jgi:ParB-like chromosome segregation protein Spo0J
MMDADKLNELAEDIRKNGQLVPVWLFEGKILDGRNRWAACKIAGVEPKTKEYTGDEPTAFAVALNDRRRHMNKGALAAVAAELEPFFAKDAKRRQQEAGREHGRGQKVVAKLPQAIARPLWKSREEAAKSVGVGERYVQDAKKVKAEAPEVFEKLKAGRITLQDAKREVAKKPTDDWRKDERTRQAAVLTGKAVVANEHADKNLIAWAESQRLAVHVDRGSRFGNPFILNDDGDRDHVCDCYERFYLPNKKSIQSRIQELRGKVLICHCFPNRCHADLLAELANKPSIETKQTTLPSVALCTSMQFAQLAISQLGRIQDWHTHKLEALQLVEDWIVAKRKGWTNGK